MLKFFFIPILALAFACVPQGVNSSHLLEQLDEEALNEELSEACLGTTQCSLGKNFSCRGRVVCDFGGGRVHAVGSRLSVEAKTYTACEDQLFELSQPLQRQYLSCPNTLRVEQIYFNNQPLAELKKAERQKNEATKARESLGQAKIAMLQSTAQRFGLQSVEGMYVLANDTRSMSDFGTKADYFQFSIWQDQLRQHLDSIDKMHEQQLADLDEQLTKK